jgi:signal transduction histidine kinase
MTPTIIIAGVAVVIIISIAKNGLTIGIGGVVLVLMFNFGFFRLLFLPSLISGLIICLAYNVAAAINNLDWPLIIANDFFLVSAVLSGAWVTYLLERLFRTQYLAERELARDRETLARQHQIDSRYLDWLRKLAAFLRHEVRQPVAQINSSIDIIQIKSDNDETLRPYFASAISGVQHVWNLIERASRATDAEAFVRQSRAQLIELDSLLVDLINDFRKLHSGIDLHLSSAERVNIHADPTQIKEAVSNLLSNAISFAHQDSTIGIDLYSNPTHAVIKVSNRGPMIQGDPEVLFGPFSSTRLGSSSEHQGIGLYLVRLIVEQHGGSATLANLSDCSGVEATILLPLKRR